MSHIPEWIEARLRASINDEQAWAALEDESLASLEPRALAAVSSVLRGPTPVEALRRASRLPAHVLEHPAFPHVAPCLHQGGYAARLMGLVPEGLDDVPRDGDPVPSTALSVETLLDRLDALAASSSVAEALGRVRTASYVLLCVQEVRRRALEDVCAGLSNLAEACVRFAVSREPILATHTVVFGMGKLAGRELNFHSDIDLVFIHAHPDAEGPDGHAARMRIHEAVRRVVASRGGGGFRARFRVGPAGLPWGPRPDLHILGAAMRYFETHGRGWERRCGCGAPSQEIWSQNHPANARSIRHRSALPPCSRPEPSRLEPDAPLRTPTLAGWCSHDRVYPRDRVLRAIALAPWENPDLQTPSTMVASTDCRARAHQRRRARALLRCHCRLRRLEHRAQLEEDSDASIGGDRALGCCCASTNPSSRPPRVADGDALERELATLRQRVIEVCDPVDEREPRTSAPRGSTWTPSRSHGTDALIEAALVRLGAHDGAEAHAMLRALRARPTGAPPR